jgi:outer membrane protein OmpA-like peptidoglycan-associated protein/tetratricopeptide (TPR) repeat protein
MFSIILSNDVTEIKERRKQKKNKVVTNTYTMRLTILCLLLCLMIAENTKAQMQLSPAATFAEALDFIQFEEYEEALALLLSIYKKEEGNNHLAHLIGVCYLNIEGQKQKALAYLETAASNMSPGHISGSFNENSAPLKNLYWLGIAYRNAYRFTESLDALNRFRETAARGPDIHLAEREMRATKNAMVFYDNPEDLALLDWGHRPPVNPLHFNVVVSGDESAIVYAEKQKFYDALFFTRNTGEGWSVPVNITRQVQSDGLAYPACLSWDGTTLFLYQYDRLSNINLYSSRYVNGRWMTMEKLGENINSAGFDRDATITRDGKSLYFSSVRPSGMGGYDIYRSRLGPDNQWGPAENLGAPVNTEHDESFPFISPDGQVLYFSSRGHTGMGGYDIFMTKKTGPGKWSVPRNLGYPVNTPGDDNYLIPVGEGNIAWYRPRREGNNDIRELQRITSFDVAPSPFSILSLDISAGSGTTDQADIKIIIRQSHPADTIIEIFSSGKHDIADLELPWGEYEIEASAPGYEPEAVSFVIPEYYPAARYDLSFGLSQRLPVTPLNQAEAIIPGIILFENRPVFFGFDRHNLCEESLSLTGYMAGILNTHREMTIELKGFTDALGPSQYNILLASRRAKAVERALKERGVESDRITVTPVGMDNYIASNRTPDGRDNPEGRKYNRRVEFSFINVPEGVQIENVLVIPPHLKNKD